MRKGLTRSTVILAAGLFLVAGQARGQYERRTAIVEAVDRTRDGIVTLKVTKPGEWGKRSIVGTGVIVDERGYLITNHHVIENATRVVVTLADKSTLEARVHKELPRYDLAILRVRTRKALKALSFGPGSDLLVGETIIAVGNPYGYTNTVSTGIISALGREIEMPSGEILTNLIQHNASINPGNSGGPLLNINGEVIGINVALREGAQGISFALNADTVKQALSRTLSALKVSKVGHGLQCDEQVAARGKERQKVVVQSAAGAAAKAGLKKGDVIVRVGTVQVSNRFDLERALWGYKAGDKVDTAILRDGKLTHVSLALSGAGASRIAAVAGTSRGR
jgi:serine protease Do